ncbi:putative chloride channel-like protein CLC-g [Hibiscus syriacus]|uniref:Chloride channel-like protein CLC-g n=1 Tax=Hibiscus syriacus TaxID=106335 RepID=A0A6A2YU31_HIBSY|nr:putative chloride channel-like protein CLC-g [Hibiscus syriacus]
MTKILHSSIFRSSSYSSVSLYRNSSPPKLHQPLQNSAPFEAMTENAPPYQIQAQSQDHESPHRSLLSHQQRSINSTSQVAIVGANVCPIESLDYEIAENDFFKQDWRTRVSLVSSIISPLRNIAGVKFVVTSNMMLDRRCGMAFTVFSVSNLVLTLFAAIITASISPAAAGSGIPEVKAYLNGVDAPDIFSPRTLMVKIVGSISAVSSSLVVGKAGPMVHIGSCIASLFGQGGSRKYGLTWRWLRFFKNDRDRRDLVTCGSAAGIASAFRAPVGGVLFALEEWLLVEKCPSLEIFLYNCCANVSYHIADVPPVLVLGVIGGILGTCPTIGRSGNYKRFQCPHDHYNDLASLIFNTNDDAIRNLFSKDTDSEFQLSTMLIFFITCFILSILSYGIVAPAGLFVPVIVTGAAYGRFIGMLLGVGDAFKHFSADDFAKRGLVLETMSLAKALILFREVGLRHLLVIPKISDFLHYLAVLVNPTIAFNPSLPHQFLSFQEHLCGHINKARFHARTHIQFASIVGGGDLIIQSSHMGLTLGRKTVNGLVLL